MIMYTITKGPSKLVTQRRTGPTQQVESKLADLKCRRQQQQQHHQQQQQHQHQQQTPPPLSPPQSATAPSQHQSHPIHAWPLSSPAPKLVFHRINGKRPPLMSLPRLTTEDNYTVAHEENVRFVYEEWQQVERQLNDCQPGDHKSGPVPYVEKSACPELKNFVPIDLDDWWAQQFLARLENGS